MARLSVVIVAQDEERTIGKVLSSVKSLASEIVLVDSGSSDKTVEIAKSFGATCHYQKWQGYATQKNFAIGLARCEWILSLDADEVPTEGLAGEIADIISAKPEDKFDGYLIPRILFVGETPIMHGGFYPDAQLRLFKAGKGEFKPRLVHESISVSGRIGKVQHPMLHYAYTDFAGFEEAMNKYARLSAQEFAASGKLGWRVSKANEWLHPWWTFFFKYVLRGGFLDGADGLKANCIYKDYVRKKITYLREAVKK
jgi:glycosyltransferase involved in cell wall biosynthesis